MPLVVVDTNALIADFALSGAQTRTFLTGSKRCGIQIYFPDVVLDELKANHAREIQRHVNELGRSKEKLERLLVPVNLQAVDVVGATKKFEDGIKRIVGEYDIDVVAYPKIAPKDIVAASYVGEKPFKEDGQGFKDYLVFQSLLDALKSENGDAWLITNNKKDFCDAEGKLHPDLKNRLPKGRTVTVLANFKEFNDAVIVPALEHLDRLAEEIKAGKFVGFSLADSVEECLQKELRNRSFSPEDLGLPEVFDEPTGDLVQDYKVHDVSVSRLADNLVVIELEGTLDLEVTGFIEKASYYLMSERKSDQYYIIDSDWNDYVMLASTTAQLSFQMSVVFNDQTKEIQNVSVDAKSPNID